MSIDSEIYPILRKHKLSPKKREELIVDLIDFVKKDRAKQLILSDVIKWVACKNAKPIDGNEYLISDGTDVTEAQWYDDSKWGGEPYDSYTHYAYKPKPPCL